MNWIEIVWLMMSSASFLLALIHLIIWLKQKGQRANLIFALLCISVASMGVLELLAMQAPSPERYAYILRLGHVPFAGMVIGIVLFIRFYFQAGNLLLGASICIIRLACLIPNFLSGDNLHFSKITAIHHLQLWGDVTIATPVGIPNPWMLLAQLSLVLLMIFMIDAMMTVWRRGNRSDRLQALRVFGSLLLLLTFSAVLAFSVIRLGFHAPISINPAFIPVLLVMSYELGGDILRAAQLARRLDATETNLLETKQYMDLAVHAANIGLWNWDMSRGTPWISEQGLRLFGFSHQETFDLGRLRDRIHVEDREGVQSAVDEAIRGNGEYLHEFRVVHADGHSSWLVARGRIDFDSAHKPLRMSGVVVDITERKQAELRFQLVVESAPAAMLMVAADGGIALANQQAEVVFGYSREELVEMNVDMLVPASFRDMHPGERTRYLANATARKMGLGRELLGQRKDGSEVPVEISLNPIHIDNQQFVLASITDISERKRMERESAIQRDELAHLSRVALLAELSGSLAHELNQPLTAILSNAQAAVRFLGHQPPNLEEVKESLFNIVENDKRAGEVIRRLRALLRKDISDYRQLEINEVVQDVIRIIRSDLLNRSVEIVLDLAPSLPDIYGDHVQLQQVLLNLIMNGSDAMKEVNGDRKLTVRTQATPTGIEVSVSDVGSGIPEDSLESIFSPFVTTKIDGMGLGLAVCTTIIQTHSGRLWASNNKGCGATLHFSLPALDK